MSPFRHILVLYLIFGTYQSAKLGDDPPPTEPNLPFNFNRTSGSMLVKISMEKTECKALETQVPTSISPALRDPEEGTTVLGTTKDNPAKSCDDVDLEPESSYYINSSVWDQPIKVKCTETSTCLSIDDEIKEESAVNSSAITLGEELWLSQTDFDVQKLYFKVEGITANLHISYLLSTSVKVSQRIRYYYGAANITTAEDTKVKSLKALLWHDQLVGSEITERMPMNFTVSGTSPCWVENKEWLCTDIMFETNSNTRLPVKDFYIEDVRIKSPNVPDPVVPENVAPIQKLYFQLTNLCFFTK